jgi:hypothetical protein
VCGLDHLGRRTIDELRLRDEEVVTIGETADHEEWLTEHGLIVDRVDQPELDPVTADD